ncbi:uncharacterized protein METZ01_LOCUS16056 [marine metagenome]|uniref:Uncharacterized protein n=1 Tax=marine metagenome TaxID=408172 RepID=A0A381P8C1_9ZZZZ
MFSHPCLTRTGTVRVPNPLPRPLGNESGHQPVSRAPGAVRSIFEGHNHPSDTGTLPQQVDSKFLLQISFLLPHSLHQLHEVKQLSATFNKIGEKPDNQTSHDTANSLHRN